MIYTVTFNPSLDYVVSVPDFQLGKTNRTAREQVYPGGKGINGSIVLQNLGLPNTALGFLAGYTGREIHRRLEQLGVSTDFIFLPTGDSRINFKLQDIEGTEINGMGPAVPPRETRALLDKLHSLRKGDVLILAGSVPPSMPSDLYSRILQELEGLGVLTVVDAAGTLLREALPYKPFLIKPNNQELGALFGKELKDRASVVLYARMLQELGARNVLVSMAGAGAVLVAETGAVFQAEAPQGTLVSGVGAGDSMVAGFVAGWLNSGSYLEAFRLGVAAGSATAFTAHLATGPDIKALYSTVKIL